MYSILICYNKTNMSFSEINLETHEKEKINGREGSNKI